MEAHQFSPELAALLPQLAQAPTPALDQLRALADAGDEDAAVFTAWAFQQAGRWPEGVPYAERAADRGAPAIAVNYASNMFGAPEHRDAALRLLTRALEAGWSIDPLGWIPALAQRGDTEGVLRLFELATTSWPRSAGTEVDELMARLRGAREEFASRLTEVEHEKEVAITAIKEHESSVSEEQERLRQLGHKVEVLAHEAAADELSRQYAQQAKRSERTSLWYTVAALVVGAGAAALAAYFTLKHINDETNVAKGVARAAIAIPIALFAAYLGGLAGRYRQIAWRWRHVELQLRTAESYISELEPERRNALIESLALRFFPGQSLDVTSGASGESDSASQRVAETELVEAAAALARAAVSRGSP